VHIVCIFKQKERLPTSLCKHLIKNKSMVIWHILSSPFIHTWHFLARLFCNIILVGLINEEALQYKFICCSFINEIYLKEGYFAVKDFKLWTSNKAYLQFLFVFTVMSCVIIAKFVCVVTYYTSYTPYLHIFTKLYGSVPRY